MTSALFALLVAMALPFVITGWRTSLMALGAQGLIMGWMAFRREPLGSADAIIRLMDLALIRGVLVPFMLHRAMTSRAAAPRGDVIPPNMFSWTLVAALIALAFRFASRVGTGGPEAQTTLAVAASGVLLGLFVLATQTGEFTQAVGALRLENAIALFELSSEGASAPPLLELGLVAVFFLTAWMFASYVRRLGAPQVAELEGEEPAL